MMAVQDQDRGPQSSDSRRILRSLFATVAGMIIPAIVGGSNTPIRDLARVVTYRRGFGVSAS